MSDGKFLINLGWAAKVALSGISGENPVQVKSSDTSFDLTSLQTIEQPVAELRFCPFNFTKLNGIIEKENKLPYEVNNLHFPVREEGHFVG